MKKVLSVIVAIALVAALGIFASAETAGEITVTYTAAESYVVTIPSSQSFSDASLSSSGTVSATALLEAGKTLKVTLNSANDFALVCGESSIDYTVSREGAILENDACVLEVEAGSTSGSSELTFATTADDIASATVAGDHIDVVTFSCSLETA